MRIQTKKRAAFLGPADAAERCKRELSGDCDLAFTTSDPSALNSMADAGDLDEVVLGNPEDGLAAQLKLASDLLQRHISVAILRPAVPHGIDGLGLVTRRLDGMPLLALPARRSGPRVGTLKRLFDILFSAAVLALGIPLWLFIALVTKLQDRGPVFFAQERIGPRERRFRFFKFRTMWPDAERHREWLEQRHLRDGHVFKVADDPRRTKFGRLLRRFSLDEVPQFWHALTGRMSVVGPRPPLPVEADRYERWQRMRLTGWFGLTGLWQVCGRSEIRNLDDIVLLDALYLHNHSLALDLRILLRTIRVVLAGRGAY